VVQIAITPPSGSYGDLERAVEIAYGLDEVVVATDGTVPAAVVPLLGQAAAAYLTRCVGDGQTLALSWGTTLLATVDAVTPQNLAGMRVVQMLGGLGSAESELYGGDLAVRLALALGAKMRLIPAPGIVASKLVRDALLQDATIAETLALAERADIALVGIGSPMPGSVVMQAGILSEQELADLKAAGAVGDVALRFFDRLGQPVEHPINDRIIGLSLEQIRRIPRVVGVAGGAGKFEVIRAAACGHLIDVLITDEPTAVQLLAER
jgi:DNA-binding transcriptional regulator LsrR (DeoR family)